MQRNTTLDYFKIFLCILVILIHFVPLLRGSQTAYLIRTEISDGIARIAVPCFFILSGYFLATKIKNWDSIRKYLKRLILIYIVWVAIYLSFHSSIGLIQVRPHNLINIFISVFVFGYKHLWYIYALITSVILLYILYGKLSVFNSLTTQIIVILVLFLCGYYIQMKSLLDAERVIFYSRNALFIGVPFIIIGKILKDYEDKLKNIPTKVLTAIVIIGVVTLLYEAHFTFEQKVSFVDTYVSLIYLCPVCILLILKFPNYKIYNDDYISLLPLAIYLVHIIPLELINFLPSEQSNIFKLPFLLLITLIMAHTLIKINNKIKIFL